ncbi:hypothetical protein AbraIFM66951_009637 [Aspergillus brasiliensis]|uniref:Uncharacterized protein n=1 Tax=Aspergillus brasiliensis TaxID=319629 RepID=A0A9W5YIF6_9EURO|nr:hypothetical protein AbraCBS73388_010004 [Aspergillus brasiliensis]GKZ46512.1 hypothetical protein AbraIFM66951_009637 [Aspergillus brasiliensis]
MSPNVVIVVILAVMVLLIAVMVCLCTRWWRHSLRSSYRNSRFERSRTGQRETTFEKMELAGRGEKKHWQQGRRTPVRPSSHRTPAPPRRPPPPPPAPAPPPRPLPPAHGAISPRHDNQPASRQEWPSVPPARSNKPPTPEEWGPAPPSRGSKRAPSKRGTPAAPSPPAKVPTKPASRDEWEAAPQPQSPSKAASENQWAPPPDPPYVASGGIKQGSKKSWHAESKPASNRGGTYDDAQGYQQQQQHGAVDPNALTAALKQTNEETHEETHEEPAEPESGW